MRKRTVEAPPASARLAAVRILDRLPPVLGASLSCIFGGSAAVATRYVIGESDATTLAFLRHAGCGLILAAIAWATLGRRFRIARADILPVVGLALLQFAIYGWLFIAALAYAPAARVSLIMTTMPLVTLGFSAWAGRERVTAAKLLAGLIALAGVAVTLGDRSVAVGPEVWKGDALIGTAVIVGAVYATLSGRYLQRNPSLAVAAISILIGAAALVPVLALQGGLAGIASISTGGWVAVLWLMGPAGVLPFYLWIWALEHASPARVVIAIALNPIAAAVLGALVVSEPISTSLLIGLVCVVAGISLAQWPARREPARP